MFEFFEGLRDAISFTVFEIDACVFILGTDMTDVAYVDDQETVFVGDEEAFTIFHLMDFHLLHEHLKAFVGHTHLLYSVHDCLQLVWVDGFHQIG